MTIKNKFFCKLRSNSPIYFFLQTLKILEEISMKYTETRDCRKRS